LWENLWELGGPSGVYNRVADYELITRYVEMTQRRRLLVSRLEAEGFVTFGSQGQEVQHPAARILADVESKLVPLEDRLGLSPQARNTIQIGHVKAKSALEAWMDE
jgi:P27 family predicted phage terminase small subunit